MNPRNIPNNGHAPLRDDESAMRKQSTREARASVFLEGFDTPAALDEIDARYISGELNDEEFEAEYLKFCRG